MRHLTTSIFTAALMALASAPASAQQGQETVLKETHGAWEVHCATSDQSKCYISQIGNGADGKPLVRVRVQKTPGLKGPEGQDIAAMIQIQTPLGVLLTAGLSLEIDGGKPGLAPYRFCTPKNCVVEEPVADQLVERMKKGATAKFSVVSALSGERASADLSLSGFTKAYNGL